MTDPPPEKVHVPVETDPQTRMSNNPPASSHGLQALMLFASSSLTVSPEVCSSQLALTSAGRKCSRMEL